MNPTADRVRTHTAQAVLRRIDDDTTASLAHHARNPADTAARLAALDREWDTDRAVETEAAFMGLLGLVLGSFVRPRFLALPAFVAFSLLVHARNGRYPLMPVFRRLGLRTAREIARERHALKALRGDFAGLDLEDDVPPAPGPAQARRTDGDQPPSLPGVSPDTPPDYH